MNCNFTHNYKVILVLFLTAFISCSDGGSDTPTPTPDPGPVEIFPSNLSLNVTLVGQDASNPNGDGSGKVICTASATNAIKYGFVFGTGSEIESTSGNIEYAYEDEGTKNYTIRVYAYSSTNNSISASQGITIYVEPVDYSTLIFADEFDSDGAPNSQNWGYDIGSGGWGNGESQYYTSRTDNVEVKDGTLRITAKKENYNGSEYTSTRMLSQDKFEFTYGKIEVKAKLPKGGGTWPAIWMLGANFSTVGWPECGEIDIMEHVGNNQNVVSSAMHTPSSYGGTINKGEQYVDGVSDEFHVYECLWTKHEIIFSVDGTEHYRYNPSNKNSSTWPYDAPQFIILNIAMGGSFGGTIDPAFTESTMEIDYVRVYQ